MTTARPGEFSNGNRSQWQLVEHIPVGVAPENLALLFCL
ncbi:MAG: hypothetical protein ACI9K5_001865 [Gammaproteobacteria bacterium]|jgi:hypothetical protein